MTTVIDKRKALSLLTGVVKEVGADHVVARCVNFNGSTPVCIVGHVYHRLGLTARDVGVADPVEDVMYNLKFVGNDRFKFTRGAVKVLQKAQDVQDNYVPWGEALEAAKEVKG